MTQDSTGISIYLTCCSSSVLYIFHKQGTNTNNSYSDFWNIITWFSLASSVLLACPFYQRKKTAFSVSPGTKSSDKEFVKAVLDSTKSGKHYRIPQYITGLLLCRNLDLEISGLNQQSTRSFVATSMSAGLNVGYGPFSLSTSFSSSNQKASFHASSTATGLQIKVPGTQVIGYYTEVVPKFPVEDTGE